MAQNENLRDQVLEELRGKLQELEVSFRNPEGRTSAIVPSGVGPLNAFLPGGGFRAGTIVEWLTEAEGSGAAVLAFRAVVPWLNAGQTCVVIDDRNEFYPAFLTALGIGLEQLLIVRPLTKDLWWALEQALLCRGVAVTVGWVEQVSNRILRRLQLAAEAGGGIGVFFRPAQLRAEPAWCHVRLLVQAMPSAESQISNLKSAIPRRARIEVLYCKGGKSEGVVEVDIHEETGAVHLAAPLAPARDARQAT